MILPVLFGGLGGVLGLSRGRKRSSFTVGRPPLLRVYSSGPNALNTYTLRVQGPK